LSKLLQKNSRAILVSHNKTIKPTQKKLRGLWLSLGRPLERTMTDPRHSPEPIAARLELNPAVIYLIGMPAVGKYTIAKEIGRLTGARVVDNQLINLPVFSVIGFDGRDAFPFPTGAWAEIEKIRAAVLTVIRDFCSPNDSFVFTNVLEARDAGDERLFRRIEQLALTRGAGFFPVWLTCSPEVLRERKDSPDRRERFKDTDVTNITRYVEDFEVLTLPHPNALTLDTSEEECGSLALRIIRHVQKVQQGT
jgi:predicted kinase